MGGKWTLAEGTKFQNPGDSVIFRQGELLFENDTVDVYNFISVDTLPRKLSLLDRTLFTVHQWGADGWNVDASTGFNGNTLFESARAVSKIKDYEASYQQAIRKAFEEVTALEYAYEPSAKSPVAVTPVAPVQPICVGTMLIW